MLAHSNGRASRLMAERYRGDCTFFDGHLGGCKKSGATKCAKLSIKFRKKKYCNPYNCKVFVNKKEVIVWEAVRVMELRNGILPLM